MESKIKDTTLSYKINKVNVYGEGEIQSYYEHVFNFGIWETTYKYMPDGKVIKEDGPNIGLPVELAIRRMMDCTGKKLFERCRDIGGKWSENRGQ